MEVERALTDRAGDCHAPFTIVPYSHRTRDHPDREARVDGASAGVPASPRGHGTVSELSATTLRRHADREDSDLRQALRRFVGGRLDHHADGEDIVQETYLRLYDYRRTRPVADAGAFCFAIARNLVRDYFSERRALPPAGVLSDEIACARPRAEEVLDYRQRVEILVRALKVMPPLRREVFLRRRLNGIATATIAADLELSIAAVEKHCTRAVADMRLALERRGLPPEAGR